MITALRQGCRVVAVPRLFEKAEHYDDHQAEITEAFAARGLIDVARGPDDLAPALERARARTPVTATSDPAELTAYIVDIIDRFGSTSRRK